MEWLLFKFVVWYTLVLFCGEFKIVLCQFLFRCGHFNLSLIANQTISDSFLEMCSPVKFAHLLSKKSRMVSSWELCTWIILQSMFVNQQMVKRNSNGRIVIKSSDNDVLLLSLFQNDQFDIGELWFQTGSITSVKDGRRLIPVHDLYNSLGAEMANILPVAHSLTGCDTTSSFFGIGKKTVYKILKQNTKLWQI